MAKQTINVGVVSNDGSGDPLRTAFVKTNANFTELYDTTEQNFNELFATANTIPRDISDLTDEEDLLHTKLYLDITDRLESLPDTLVSFVKPPNTSVEDVFDPIDVNLSLTRDGGGIGGLGGGIYNIALENAFEATISPLGTTWNLDGWDNLDNVKLRFYEPLREVFRNRIGNNIIGAKLVMHDTINDKYYKFEFSQWQQGPDHTGNFAYTRELINTEGQVGITFPDGSIQVSAPAGFRGFREIFLGDTSQYDIQPKDAGKFLQAFGTTLYVPDEEGLGFRNGDYIVLVAGNQPLVVEPRNAATIYNPDGNTDLWTIQARTTAILIKTDVDTWNLTGKTSFSTGDITFDNADLLAPEDTSINVIINDQDDTYTWTFASDGTTYLPMNPFGNITYLSTPLNDNTVDMELQVGKDLYISVDNFTPSSVKWKFAIDGTLGFPDGGTLRVGTAPTSSVGVLGNKQGEVAYDSSYVYYCTADYTDGLSDIWKRQAWSTDTW